MICNFCFTRAGQHRTLNLREHLDHRGFRLGHGCAGEGACGRCRVRILRGSLPAPTACEQALLSRELLDQGIRLACQVVPTGDLLLELLDAPWTTGWRPLPPCEVPACQPPVWSDLPLAVAVDLGTTHIRVTLVGDGRRLAGQVGGNPQGLLGADVLHRLQAAAQSARAARRLARLAGRAVAEALTAMAVNRRQVGNLVLVGNAAMLALLARQPVATLLQPEGWDQPWPALNDALATWRRPWGFDPRARLRMVPPVAGFVGSDLLAGLWSVDFMAQPAGTLFIDFGTNTEVALWDGQTIQVASTPGGPAFEASGVGCGMPAMAGAITDFHWAGPGHEPAWQVMGGPPAMGLCGSGLVALLAALRQVGVLHPSGRFARDWPGNRFVLQQTPVPLVLGSSDVDLFQRAKAAVAASLACLLTRAGMTLTDISRLYVTGAFGRFLRVESAQAVGLLPPLSPDQVICWPDAALRGAEALLFLPPAWPAWQSLVRATRVVHLSMATDFEDRFVANLALAPMRLS